MNPQRLDGKTFLVTGASQRSQSFLAAYSSSKGALTTLTKNNANALRRDRIRPTNIEAVDLNPAAEELLRAAELPSTAS